MGTITLTGNNSNSSGWRNFLLILVLVKIHSTIAFPPTPPDTTVVYEENLPSKAKLNDAKLLRVDLTNQIKYMEEIIKQLDGWAFEEIAGLMQSDTFNEEIYQTLEEQMRTLQKNYTEVSEECLNTNKSIHDIKRRSTELLLDLESFNKQLDSDTVECVQLFCDYRGMNCVISQYTILNEQIKTIFEEVVEKEQTFLANNIVDEINKKNYKDAAVMSDLIKYDNKITHIVNKVYSGNANRFYSILNFGDHITNETRIYQVYKQLNDVARHNGDITMNKIVALLKSLAKCIINKPLGNEEIKNLSISLSDNLKLDLKTFAIIQLTDNLENNEISKSNLILLKKILSLDEELALDIIYQAYEDLAYTQDIDASLQKMFKLLSTDILSDQGKMRNLAYIIKRFLLKVGHIGLLDSYIKAVFKSKSIMALLQPDKICINKMYKQEYLRASELEQIGILNHYRVHTYSDSNGYLPEEVWILEYLHDDLYKIGNFAIAKTYLDVINEIDKEKSDEYFDYVSENLSRHKVTLNRNYENNQRSIIWQIILKDEYCLIKNVNNGEYLYTSEHHGTDCDAYTGDLNQSNDDDFKWQLTDCSNFDSSK